MPSLSHTGRGLEVLDLFYKGKVVVYVEENDDKLFWSMMLERAGKSDFYVAIAGGKEELVKICSKIQSTEAKILVAWDNDYSEALGEDITGTRIIRTYGYSIENTLYCPRTLSLIIGTFCRECNDFEPQIVSWYNDFTKECIDFLLYDLASVKYSRGIEVMGNCSCRFLRCNSSSMIDRGKISEHIDTIKNAFTTAEISTCRGLILAEKRELRYLIRGHFLTNAVLNLIKELVKGKMGSKPNIPKGNLYVLCVNGCKYCTSSNCEDTRIVRSNIEDCFRAISR